MTPDPKKTQEFVGLLTDHQESIRAYIISQLPGSPDVRDILQEVNLFLWENMNKFEPGSNFGAWACAVAHFRILDHRKKMKRDRFVVFDEELSRKLAVEIQDRTSVTSESKRMALRGCLEKLSPDNKALLEARYRSTRGELGQLSDELGRSRASLRVSLVRLRSALRRCIEAKLALEGARS